jgi:hypothetical protein
LRRAGVPPLARSLNDSGRGRQSSSMSLRNKRVDPLLRAAVLAMYRKCIRVSRQLEPNHQQVWYDYAGLKFREHKSLKDPRRVKSLLEDAKDEIDFVLNIIVNKTKKDRNT